MSNADGGKRVALVTGSSRGIGRALVEHLLASNFDVHGVSRSENRDLTSESYTHHVCDLQDAESIQKVFSTLRKNGVQLDTVVNNAGVLTSQYAMILSPEAAKDMVLTNLWAPFVVSREAARLMRKTGWGRIVHIGSMAPTLEAEGDSVYAACKAGLQMLSNVMAREFSSLNITSNVIGISAFETEMLQQLDQSNLEKVMQQLPISRKAEIGDITNVLDFFISRQSSYITAQTVYLAGAH